MAGPCHCHSRWRHAHRGTFCRCRTSKKSGFTGSTPRNANSRRGRLLRISSCPLRFINRFKLKKEERIVTDGWLPLSVCRQAEPASGLIGIRVGLGVASVLPELSPLGTAAKHRAIRKTWPLGGYRSHTSLGMATRNPSLTVFLPRSSWKQSRLKKRVIRKILTGEAPSMRKPPRGSSGGGFRAGPTRGSVYGRKRLRPAHVKPLKRMRAIRADADPHV